MFRKFALTGLIAASIATAPITSSAAYAKNDLEKLLIGLAAVGIVGAIVHDNKQPHRQVVTKRVHQPRSNVRTHRHGKRVKPGTHRHGNYVHRHHREKVNHRSTNRSAHRHHQRNHNNRYSR